MKDCLGREWQMGTIQVDFQLPRRFDLSYIAEDGSKKVPVMLHRAIFGSLERFIGIITEHYAGAFPLWLAPVQIKVIPVSDKFLDYAKEVASKLDDNKIRVEVDERAEKVGYKIREAVMEKVPYIIVVGEKDMNDKTVTVRKRREESQEAMSLDKFIERLNKEVDEKDPDVPKLGE